MLVIRNVVLLISRDDFPFREIKRVLIRVWILVLLLICHRCLIHFALELMDLSDEVAEDQSQDGVS